MSNRAADLLDGRKMKEHERIDIGGSGCDLCRRPECGFAVAAELFDSWLTVSCPSSPCPPEGKARDIRPIQPVAIVTTEVKRPLGNASIAHGAEEAFEVLTVAEVGEDNTPQLHAVCRNVTAGLCRCVAGFAQTTGTDVGRCEENRDSSGLTQRFGTGAFQCLNCPGVITIQQERHACHVEGLGLNCCAASIAATASAWRPVKVRTRLSAACASESLGPSAMARSAESNASSYRRSTTWRIARIA